VTWETEQTRMVERLRRAGVAGPRVLDALARVPRDVFVDESVRHLAFKDVALPIEGQQTISQPTVVAMMTEALDAGPQDTVLEVGTGSGYQAAVLAELAGSVLTIERQPALADLAARRLSHLGYHNVEVVVGDGAAGLPERAPFSRILVAAAPPRVPPALIEQLGPGGRLVLPVGEAQQQLLLLTRAPDGVLTRRSLGRVRFVPLLPGVAGPSTEDGE
jgi:protein-L-isoaspartate(D-aspartate) O-methyltransferase